MAQVSVRNAVDIKVAGQVALRRALGSVNTARFMQQFWYCSGDYTKEKYELPEPSREEIIASIMANRAKKAS